MAISWLKSGDASKALVEKEKQEAQKRKEEQGKMWRFWLKAGEECRITFVDGDLSPEGFLLPPRLYEHNVKLNGTYGNLFVCPEKTNPESGDKCPICEGGDRPSLIALFTVIDHRVFPGKDGKEYRDTPKLLAAKSQSFEMLNKLATKLGGLAGQTFDVSRSDGDKSPQVGDLFIPVEKKPLAELQAKYFREYVDPKTNIKTKVATFVPAKYEEEIVYRGEDELRKMGFGKSGVTGGGYALQGTPAAAASSYNDHL